MRKQFRDNWATLQVAVGDKRYMIGAIVTAAFSWVTSGLLYLSGSVIGMSLLPGAIVTGLVFALLLWWVLTWAAQYTAKQKRDVWFAEAVYRIVHGAWPDSGQKLFSRKLDKSRDYSEQIAEHEASQEFSDVADALLVLQQAALDGDLIVWGKNGMTVEAKSLKDALFDAVPVAHWRQGARVRPETLFYSRPEQIHTDGGVDFTHWVQLRVSKRHVEAVLQRET